MKDLSEARKSQKAVEATHKEAELLDNYLPYVTQRGKTRWKTEKSAIVKAVGPLPKLQ